MMQENFCSSFGEWTNHVHYTMNSKYDQFWMMSLTQTVNTVQSSGPRYIKQDRSYLLWWVQRCLVDYLVTTCTRL